VLWSFLDVSGHGVGVAWVLVLDRLGNWRWGVACMLSRIGEMSMSNWVRRVSTLLTRLVGLGDERRLGKRLKSLGHKSGMVWVEANVGHDVAI